MACSAPCLGDLALKVALIDVVTAAPHKRVSALLRAVADAHTEWPCTVHDSRALLSMVATAFGAMWAPRGGFPRKLRDQMPSWWPMEDWHGASPGNARRYASAAIVVLTSSPCTSTLRGVAAFAEACEDEDEVVTASPILVAVLTKAHEALMHLLAAQVIGHFPCEEIFNGYMLLDAS